jgi:dTMP kinase
VPGRFIVLEGIDGCGKSTQARRLAAAHDALLTCEPGGTALGTSLREVLLRGAPMTPLAEALVLAADRAQHLAEVVVPALDAGRDVVCDRYSGSTLAYQGYGRGVPLPELRSILEVATAGREPDRTVLLDCPVEVGRARRGTRDPGADRFEDAGDAFLERVRSGYLELATASAGWIVVDATAPLQEVDAAVDEALADAWH